MTLKGWAVKGFVYQTKPASPRVDNNKQHKQNSCFDDQVLHIYCLHGCWAAGLLGWGRSPSYITAGRQLFGFPVEIPFATDDNLTFQMDSTYYKPANVFRQPAIIVKKNSSAPANVDKIAYHKKSWQNDVSRLGSPLLRKASDDFNDYYTTKKLESQYWNMNNETKANGLPTGLSVVDDTLLVSNMDCKDNLKLLKLQQDQLVPRLQEMQTISVPGTPITSTSLLPQLDFTADYFEGHDQLLLTGHQDGTINLISTSTEHGDAKIVKRYKNGKFLSRQDPASLDNWLQSFTSLPVRKIMPWNQRGLVSLVNDSIFIYDINGSRSPQYLQSFPGIESFAVNKNPYLLSLCGSQFGRSGIALLDLRCDQKNSGNLYIPDSQITSSRLSQAQTSSYDCVWLDEYHLANCVNDTVKVWDIRSTGGEAKIEMVPMKGCIQSLSYHEGSKTLYTSDDQGFIISWDMTRIENMKKATLAQGFNSIVVPDQESLHEVSQCGNIVVNGASIHTQHNTGSVHGSVFMDTLSNGSLATLDSRELGVHRIRDVECIAPASSGAAEEKNDPVSNVGLENPEYKVSEDSDFISSNEISSFSMHSDCSSEHTSHSEEEHVNPNYSKHYHNDSYRSIYTLNDNMLSGSTIYH